MPRYSKHLTTEQIQAYIKLLESHIQIVPEPPDVFSLPRDPDDEVYINTAIAYKANFLVTRDKDLLEYELKDPFQNRLRIVDPVTFLAEIS